MKKTFQTLLPIVLLASYSSAFAQLETAESTKESLRTIYITSSRQDEPVEESITAMRVITQEEIIKSGASNVADVLRRQPGLNITSTSEDVGVTVDMRGFGAAASSNVLILLDGKKLNNPDLRAPSLSSIVLDNIERIEIIRGSAGSLYGDQAVGGVINIITRNSEGFVGKLNTLVGSYGRKGINVNLGNEIFDNTRLQVFAERYTADNYRDNNTIVADHLFSKLAYKTDSLKWFLESQYDFEDTELPGALLQAEVNANRVQSLPAFKDDFAKRKENAFRAGADAEINSNWSFLFETGQRHEDVESAISFRSGFTSRSETSRKQQFFTPRFLGRFSLPTGDLHITTGADLNNTNYQVTRDNAQNDQEIQSYYVQARLPLNSGFDLGLGARLAKVNNDIKHDRAFPNGGSISDSVSVYNLGLSKQLGNVRSFIRYDENFRFAKVDELTFVETGKQSLESQTGQSFELGSDIELKNTTIKVLAYLLKLKNEIAYDPTVDGPFGAGTGANVNFKSTERKGISIEADVQLSKSVALSAAYGISENQFTSGVFKGKEIAGVPEDQFDLQTEYQISNTVGIALGFEYKGAQFLSGDNNNTQKKKPGYGIVNFSSWYEVDNWTMNLRLNNVLDKEYSESENAFGAVNPSPERNLLVKVGYNF